MATKQYAARVTIGGAIESSFKSSFGSATSAIKELGSEVKALSRQRAEIKAFGSSYAKIDKLKVSLDEANRELVEARRNLANAEKPTAKLTAAVEKAERKIRGLEKSLADESTKLSALKNKLDQAGIGTRNLERADAKLEARIRRITTAMHSQERASERLATARGRLGSMLGSGVAVGAAAAAFAPALKAAGDFESKLFEISRTGNLAKEQVQKIRDGIDAAANRDITNRSPMQLLEAVGQLVAQGADSDTAVKSITSIGRASVATGSTMEDLTSTLHQMQIQLGITADESEKAFGILATAGKKGSFEIRDMAQYFPTLAATAANIGIKGEKGIATLGAALQVARTGAGDSSTAANNLLNLLAKITAPATVERMKKFGVDWEKVMRDAAEKGADPLIVALDEIQKVTGGDSFQIGKIFEDMQVKAALLPLLRSRQLFADIRKEALASGAVIEEDFNKSLKSWPEILASGNNSFEKIGKTIGDILLPIVGNLTVSFSKTVDSASKWAEKNTILFRGIVVITGGLIAATAAVVAVGIALAAANVAVAGISAALAGFGVMAAAAGVTVGGLGLILGGVAVAIGAAAVLIWKYWEPINAFFDGIWQGIKSGWDAAGGAKLWQEFTDTISWAGREILKWFEPVKGTFAGVFNSGKTMGEFIGVTLVGLFRLVMDPIGAVKDIIGELGRAFELAFAAIKNAAEPVLHFLSEKMAWITEKIGGVIESLKGIGKSLPKWMGGAPAAHAGGALPKETGFTPPAMRGDGNRTANYNIHVNAPGADGEDIARRIRRAFQTKPLYDSDGALVPG